MELVSSKYCQGKKLDSSAKLDLYCNLGLFQCNDKDIGLCFNKSVESCAVQS